MKALNDCMRFELWKHCRQLVVICLEMKFKALKVLCLFISDHIPMLQNWHLKAASIDDNFYTPLADKKLVTY